MLGRYVVGQGQKKTKEKLISSSYPKPPRLSPHSWSSGFVRVRGTTGLGFGSSLDSVKRSFLGNEGIIFLRTKMKPIELEEICCYHRVIQCDHLPLRLAWHGRLL